MGGDGDVVYPHYGEEQPPEFMPYEAKSFTTGDGHVVSHDPHLNEDGSSLANQHLMSHAYYYKRLNRRGTLSFPTLTRLRPSQFYFAHQRDAHRTPYAHSVQEP
jgi:hypothetical protein